jgi:hypothetical protein
VRALFRIDPAGTAFAVLHTFDKMSGAAPYATPTLHTNGRIYGTTSTGGPAANGADGVVYGFDVGLKPFAAIVGTARAFNSGDTIGLIGQGFGQTTSVSVGSTAARYKIMSETYMLVFLPAACPGPVTVVETGVTLVTPQSISVKAVFPALAPRCQIILRPVMPP